jgi:hypothetical protein
LIFFLVFVQQFSRQLLYLKTIWLFQNDGIAHLFKEAEILTIENLIKFPKISSFSGHAGLHPISHLALAITRFPPFLLLGSVGVTTPLSIGVGWRYEGDLLARLSPYWPHMVVDISNAAASWDECVSRLSSLLREPL